MNEFEFLKEPFDYTRKMTHPTLHVLLRRLVNIITEQGKRIEALEIKTRDKF